MAFQAVSAMFWENVVAEFAVKSGPPVTPKFSVTAPYTSEPAAFGVIAVCGACEVPLA